MRVEMFNVGWLTVSLGLLRKGEAMEEMVRVPVPAFLIEAGEERILVDTGLNPGAVADPDAFYGQEHAYGPFAGEQERSRAAQVDLETITRVVLTHLHWAHVGGLPHVPDGIPVVVQRIEWEAGHDQTEIQRNFFLPADYIGDRPIELVDGDHDLLGDGSVRLLFTPGHTPGHQSVQVGDLIIAGDVVHFTAALDDLRLPLFGDDLEAQARSAERLRELRDAGATVIPSHEPALHHPGELRG
jgi:glyoxylase-like metal-dependent hydrolase (beta-lactamase superfamily II)